MVERVAPLQSSATLGSSPSGLPEGLIVLHQLPIDILALRWWPMTVGGLAALLENRIR